MSPQRIGFIGLGNMGGRMTRRIIDAGHRVLGYDPVPGRAAAAGATAAASVTEVVQGSDCILLSLPDSRVIERVIRGESGVGGEGGVLTAGRAGQVVMDLSTAA